MSNDTDILAIEKLKMSNTECYVICRLKFPVYTETSAVDYSVRINISAVWCGE